MDALRRWAFAATLAVSMTVPAAWAEAQQVVWKAALIGPPRAVTAPLEWFAREVAARTGGQVKIELVYGEALAKATEMPEGVKAGAFEVAMIYTTYYPAKFPLYNVLDLPMFPLQDVSAQARVQFALGEHPTIVEEMKRWNVRFLLPTVAPLYQVMGNRRIVKAEDFKGVRMRVSGEMARVLEEYGVVKTLVSVSEVYSALERGLIDAVALPVFSLGAFKIHEISKYFIDGISLGTPPGFYGVSEAAWARLAPEHQKLMIELREGAIQQFAKAFAAAEQKYIPEFRQKGVETIQFPAAEHAKLAARAEKYWRAWVEDKERRGLKGRSVFEFVQARMGEHAKR